MNTHNFGTVLAFELRRTLLRPTYWLATLSVPALIAIVMGLSFFSSSTAAQQAESAGKGVTFTYSDASGIVVPAVAAKLGGTPASDPAAAAQAVREGRADAYIAVPADPAGQPVAVTARDDGVFNSGHWFTLGQNLVELSAVERIGDPQLVALTRNVGVDVELWKDGRPSLGLAAGIVPGAFLVLLYAAILMLGQQMLNITVEEKENRVTEMILTTIKPTVLILAKVTAVIIAGLVQAAVFLVPVLIWLVATGGQLPQDPTGQGSGLPTTLVIDPAVTTIAVLLFVGGFSLFTALLVAIGAMVPTVKDGSSAFGAVVLLMFLPLYVFPLVAGDPRSIVTQFLTYFPITAPIAAQVRNATGSLPVPEAVIALLVLYGTAAVLLWVAVRLFGQGSIAYDARLRLSSLGRALGRGK